MRIDIQSQSAVPTSLPVKSTNNSELSSSEFHWESAEESLSVVDPLMRLKVQVSLLSEIRHRMQFINREVSYLLKLKD